MSTPAITVTQDGCVTTITLDRPDRLNAMAPGMADEISAALGALGGARALLITGAGRAFCAGADLAVSDGPSIAGGDAAADALIASYNPMMTRIAELDVPVVTAVNGAAAGIGCSLALAGDFCVAGTGAYFLQAFVNIGLVPDGGASWTLPRLIGTARATQMMMLGERVSAPQAEAWGMIYRTVDDAVLLETAQALAARLAAGPTRALGLMRQNLRTALASDQASALAREAEAQRMAGDSADCAEGMLAFAEKRKPLFTGG